MRTLKQVTTESDMTKIKHNFFVFDTETTKLEPKSENFVFGVLYAWNWHKVFYSPAEFIEELKHERYKGKYIFAHNAEFDLLTIFGNIYTEVDNTAIFNGKFISAKYGHVTFADSMNIFPTSVEKIGKLIGLDKLENKKVKSQGLRKENITAEDVEYCKRDCKIVFVALQRIFELTGAIKLTLPSLAMYDFRKNYLPGDLHFSELVDEFYDSYYGGRTEAFKIGKVNAKVYDVNSMYPYAMVNTVFPDVKSLKKEIAPDVKFLNHCLKYYEGMASVDVAHKDTFFGYLPCRMEVNKSEKLVFPVGKFSTVVNFNELRYALQAGVIEIKKVHYIVYANPAKSPFVEFILDNYKKRNESKDELNRLIYKLKMNSLYGRFAMRMKLSTAYYDEIPFQLIQELKEADKYCDLQLFNADRNDCYVITENEKFKNSFFSIPTFSSYITSTARVMLLQALTANEKNGICYCDTDSVFLEGKFIGKLSDELGDFKLEDKQVTAVFGLKNYIYKDHDGKEVIVIKGISKNAVKKSDPVTGQTVYEVPKYIKTKQALRQNKEAGTAFIMKKTLTGKYDKRIVNHDGTTKPIKI